MISEIINNSMDADFGTLWIPLTDSSGKLNATSLQLTWKNVTGILNGIINIYTANSQDYGSLALTIDVDSATNENDTCMITVYPMYYLLRIEFQKNGITGGLINGFLYYSEI